MSATVSCRSCDRPLRHVVVDLGMSPLANAYVAADDLHREERFYPLKVFVCDGCWLVQLPEAARPEEIFSDYAYFSSFSDSWLEHVRGYVARMVERFGLDATTPVVELASNDGYLLRYVGERGIPVLGVEPAANVAAAAEKVGVPSLVAFFGTDAVDQVVKRVGQPKLLVGNNVLAHVPELNDFVAGMKQLLAPDGVITMEFPHLVRLIEGNQFDTIYHEHFSYFSATAVSEVFRRHALRLFDVDEVPTHGGSLRIYACHADSTDDRHRDSGRPAALVASERDQGFTALERYLAFGERVAATKRRLLSFLIEARDAGKTVAAYGAAAKGNTLLNYCGIGTDLVAYVVDRSPHKQGRYLPGTRLPIHAPEHLRATRPDLVLILPWNIKDEIVAQMAEAADWGGRFVVPIPKLQVL